MSQVIPFQFDRSPVRVIEINGDPWFVARDVAEALGYAKARNAVSAHCKGALKQGVPTISGIQDMLIIPERDVYRLIMRSKLPSAERFEEWVVGDVLPAIRKKGSYNVAELSRKDILKIALEAEEERLRLEKKVQADAPKVAFAEAVGNSDGCHDMASVAKMLGTGRNKLFQALRDRRILTRSNLPMQSYIDNGYFRVVERPFKTGEVQRLYAQTLVTAKGLAFLQRSLTH